MKSLNNQFLLNHYQARKGQTLVAHLRECAETASCLLNQIGLSRMGQVLGWCHDVGKLSDAFASYLEETSRNSDKVSKLRGTVDHSTAGAQLVWRKMNLQAKESLSSGLILRQMLALCIASHHHDSLLDCWRGRFSDDAILCNRLNKEDQDSHYEEIIGKLTPENLEFYGNLLDAKQLIDEFKSIYSLLTESREGWKDAPFYFGMLTRLMLSVLISADYKSASGGGSLEQCVVPDWQTIQNKLEETYMEHFTSDSELNRCRNKMSTACFEAGKREQGIYTLTLPTGAGKTLASLRFAVEHARRHSLARIVYVIPYTTILDQTARVIRRALGEEWCRYNLVEHHSNFCPEYQGQNQDSWDPERKNWYMEACLTWDVPIVLTTSVQYLNACFTAGKQHVRRMNSLMNSVVIFDEVQAIPWSSRELFEMSLNFWAAIGKATLLTCTATQPISSSNACFQQVHKGELIPETSKYADRIEEFRRVQVQWKVDSNEYWTLERMADLVIESARENSTVLVIVNTKTLAIKLYRQCQNLATGGSCYHLSTNMCPAHRLGIINEKLSKQALNVVRQNGESLICISTQLIEAGVDVDFDVVIRSVAGLDSCMQAAGRCNRDAVRSSGKVIVINPANNLENTSNMPELDKAIEVAHTMISYRRNELAQSGLSNDVTHDYFERYQKELNETIAKDYTKYLVSVPKLEYEVPLVDLLNWNYSLLPKNTRQSNYKEFGLFQAFDLASTRYQPIDDESIAVLTCYGEGARLIGELSAMNPLSPGDWDLWKDTLRKARAYSIPVRKKRFDMLLKDRVIYPIREEVPLFALSPDRYDQEIGMMFDDFNSLIC